MAYTAGKAKVVEPVAGSQYANLRCSRLRVLCPFRREHAAFGAFVAGQPAGLRSAIAGSCESGDFSARAIHARLIADGRRDVSLHRVARGPSWFVLAVEVEGHADSLALRAGFAKHRDSLAVCAQDTRPDRQPGIVS